MISVLFVLTGAAVPEVIPVPEPRPDVVILPKDPAAKTEDDPGKTKKDPQKPADTKPEEDKPSEDKPGEAVEEKPVPVANEDTAKLSACLAELKALGVSFKDAPRVDDGGGCGMGKPITVTSLGGDLVLAPEGQMRCETALQLTRWTRQSVIPALKLSMPDETLTTVNQASTYICRKRNNAETGKISEHAHGNAVDIAGFTFKSGKTFNIEPREEDSTLVGAFQRTITAAACLYFTTVLDPGSDAAHEKHLHLDVIERKNGYRLCW